jgi:hypothetical protein
MKIGIKTSVAFMTALALLTVYIPEALAYITLNGVVPVGANGIVILQAHKVSGATTDTLKFKFTAPSFDAGVPYALTFCVGPVTNPCGSPTSYTVQVPAGEERLAVVPAQVFANNVLVVGQGTRRPVPYSVTIE